MIRLPKAEGFPQDLRNARVDEIAEHYALKHFGSFRVDSVARKLHRSQISKEAMLTDLKEYDRVYAGRLIDDTVYEMAFESVRRELTPDKLLTPLTLGAVEQHPELPKNRSPGLPWKQQGYKTKRDCLEDPAAVAVWHRKWDNIGRGRGNTSLPDAALFLRAQIARQGVDKIRAVWGFPIDVIIEEGRTFYPYMEWLREQDSPIAYHVEVATGGMQYVNSMLKSYPDAKYIVSDWSKFDKTVPAWLIMDAFSLIFNSFDMSHVQDSEGLYWPVNSKQSTNRCRKVMRYFINTPIRMCDGTRWRKTGGVPSGSMFTNLIDSIVNLIVIRYMTYQTTGRFPDAEIVLGDDAVFLVSDIANIDDMAEVAKESFGMDLNAHKSYVTTNSHNVHFIGYYNRDGKPFKPQDFAVASFIFPERTVDPDDHALRIARAVGQMWSTMDGAQAAVWWYLIKDMMIAFSLTVGDIETRIKENSHQFKYLKILGVDPLKMTIPDMSQDFVWRVEAAAVARRQFVKKKSFDYQELVDSIQPPEIDLTGFP